MEKYITPEMEIIKFEAEDIITGSDIESTAFSSLNPGA